MDNDDLDRIQASLDAYGTSCLMLGNKYIDIGELISEIRRLRTENGNIRNALRYAQPNGMGRAE